MTIERIVKKFEENHPGQDTSMLYLAYEFAAAAHAGQKRKTGERGCRPGGGVFSGTDDEQAL